MLSQQLYVHLFAWALYLTGQPIPEVYPVVLFVDQQTLDQETCVYVTPDNCGSARGMYLGGDEVFITNRFDPETSIVAQSYIVHEMVHYLQKQKQKREGIQRTDMCESAKQMEREAYSAQNKFLEAKHHKLRVGGPDGTGISLPEACVVK